jgi:2-dehydro-3-deoxygluconokinase
MVELAPREGGLYAMGFAGDTFNTAWYAQRLGGDAVDVGYLTALGDDAASDDLEQFIRDAGIQPIAPRRPGRAVGLYLISLKEGERSFSYWRDTSAARSLADDLERLDWLRPKSAVSGSGSGPADVAFFSGITLAILPPEGRARLLDVLRRARAEGVTVAFDPNLRPRLWESAEAMRGWVTEGASVSDILLPSHEDEADHFGDASPAATAARYVSAGAGLVVVKDGPGPVRIVDQGGEHLVPPQTGVVPVDTTAAGDSFNARFLTGLLRGETSEAAAHAACAVSAQVIVSPGALVPI